MFFPWKQLNHGKNMVLLLISYLLIYISVFSSTTNTPNKLSPKFCCRGVLEITFQPTFRSWFNLCRLSLASQPTEDECLYSKRPNTIKDNCFFIFYYPPFSNNWLKYLKMLVDIPGHSNIIKFTFYHSEYLHIFSWSYI